MTEERIVRHEWNGNCDTMTDMGRLIRCRDCRYYDFGLCDNVPKNTAPRYREETFFCADGKPKGCAQDG